MNKQPQELCPSARLTIRDRCKVAAIALAFWVIFTGVFGMIRACGEPLAAELLVEPGANVNGIEREGMTHLNWMTICNKERGIQTLRTLGGLLCDELDRNNDR